MKPCLEPKRPHLDPSNGPGPGSAAGAASGGPEEPVVLGSYQLIELIGEGGMGRVYLAEHTKLGRRVAIKLLRSEYSQNKMAVGRFFTEARAVNQINHEHIVEITDFVENETGDNYYVMELLKGQTLEALLDERGPLPLSRTLSIGIQVCSALAAVHEAGIVHRDLKPANIFLTQRWGQQDFVKLLDFGVVKLTRPMAGEALSETHPGLIVGTPEYMSPEQAAGKAIDSRSDLGSLGTILYEIVTGQKPFTGETYGELLLQLMTVTPRRPAQLPALPHRVPAQLDDLIMRCLEKSPDMRPPSAEAVLGELRAIADKERCELAHYVANPGGALAAVPAARKRRRWRSGVTIAAGAAVILAAVGVLGMQWATRSESSRSSPAASPPPEPARAAKVHLSFDSVPRGADVSRAGSAQVLGVTPLTLALPRSQQQQTFELRLAGHRPERRQVSLEGDARIMTTLTLLPNAADEPPAADAPARAPTTARTVPRTPAASRRSTASKAARGGVNRGGARGHRQADRPTDRQERPKKQRTEQKEPYQDKMRGGTLDPFAAED